MTVLLELRERLRGFYGKYESYLLPVIKFLLGLTVFWLINANIGYMERLDSTPLILVMALACSILPMAVMLLAAGALLTLHCYALSMQAGVMMFLLFAVMYLLYFRFTPQHAYNVLLTPIAYLLGIPYVLPVAIGLLQHPAAVIPTICGVITYYFLNGIMANETSIAASDEGEEEIIAKFQEIINQFTANREMYLVIAIFVFTTLVVYAIRRLSMDYAWTVAIITGMLMQYLGFFMGDMQMGITINSITLTFGCGISAAVLLVIQFFFFNLDYTRTERVQFEDDEYYYYVKAIPKRYVSTRAKTVKKISTNHSGHSNYSNHRTSSDVDPDPDADGEQEEPADGDSRD